MPYITAEGYYKTIVIKWNRSTALESVKYFVFFCLDNPGRPCHYQKVEVNLHSLKHKLEDLMHLRRYVVFLKGEGTAQSYADSNVKVISTTSKA